MKYTKILTLTISFLLFNGCKDCPKKYYDFDRLTYGELINNLNTYGFNDQNPMELGRGYNSLKNQLDNYILSEETQLIHPDINEENRFYCEYNYSESSLQFIEHRKSQIAAKLNIYGFGGELNYMNEVSTMDFENYNYLELVVNDISDCYIVDEAKLKNSVSQTFRTSGNKGLYLFHHGDKFVSKVLVGKQLKVVFQYKKTVQECQSLKKLDAGVSYATVGSLTTSNSQAFSSVLSKTDIKAQVKTIGGRRPDNAYLNLAEVLNFIREFLSDTTSKATIAKELRSIFYFEELQEYEEDTSTIKYYDYYYYIQYLREINDKHIRNINNIDRYQKEMEHYCEVNDPKYSFENTTILKERNERQKHKVDSIITRLEERYLIRELNKIIYDENLKFEPRLFYANPNNLVEGFTFNCPQPPYGCANLGYPKQFQNSGYYVVGTINRNETRRFYITGEIWGTPQHHYCLPLPNLQPPQEFSYAILAEGYDTAIEYVIGHPYEQVIKLEYSTLIQSDRIKKGTFPVLYVAIHYHAAVEACDVNPLRCYFY